jgi:hypothetical protein
MIFKEDRQFAVPEAAEQTLLELANAMITWGGFSVAVINEMLAAATRNYGAATTRRNNGLMNGINSTHSMRD